MVALIVAAHGCANQRVEWDSERRVTGVMAPGSTLVLLEAGVPAVRAVWEPVRWPDDSLACDGTRTAIRALGDTVYASWWTRAAPAEVRLVASRSDDAGIHWRAADTVGRAASARTARDSCRRPAAGLGLDSTSGGVLVVYHGQAAEHQGVLLVRYSAGTPRAVPPALVAEGASTGIASVASAGDTVAVVFESPLPNDIGVWLAISSVSGDIPGIRVALSASGIRAFAPAVAMRDGRVAVAWNEPRRGEFGPAAVARVGRIAR